MKKVGIFKYALAFLIHFMEKIFEKSKKYGTFYWELDLFNFQKKISKVTSSVSKIIFHLSFEV